MVMCIYLASWLELVVWLVGILEAWMVLWSPGAAGAFLWRPPGCPYSGRQAEALGRSGGGKEGGGRGGTQGLNYWKEWADLLPNPFNYTCNPVWPIRWRRCCWVLAAWWTNDHKWWRSVAALVQHIPGYYWCRSTRPKHYYKENEPLFPSKIWSTMSKNKQIRAPDQNSIMKHMSRKVQLATKKLF